MLTLDAGAVALPAACGGSQSRRLSPATRKPVARLLVARIGATGTRHLVLLGSRFILWREWSVVERFSSARGAATH
jgi:hypothetical protein